MFLSIKCIISVGIGSGLLYKTIKHACLVVINYRSELNLLYLKPCR